MKNNFNFLIILALLMVSLNLVSEVDRKKLREPKVVDFFDIAKPLDEVSTKAEGPVFTFTLGEGANLCVGINLNFYTAPGAKDHLCGPTACKRNIIFRGCKTISRNGLYGISAATMRTIWQDNGTGCPNPALTKRCAIMADNASAADFIGRVLTCDGSTCTRDNATAGNIFLNDAGGSCGCLP